MKNILKSKNLETILQPMERGQITLPKAIRDAAGITPDTWLWVRYLPSGKIEVEIAKDDLNDQPSLVAALIKLKKAKKPIWTDGDSEGLKQMDNISKQQLRDIQKEW